MLAIRCHDPIPPPLFFYSVLQRGAGLRLRESAVSASTSNSQPAANSAESFPGGASWTCTGTGNGDGHGIGHGQAGADAGAYADRMMVAMVTVVLHPLDPLATAM